MISATRLDRKRIEENRSTGAWSAELLSDHVDLVARSTPDRVAIVDGDRSTSYGELAEMIRTATSGLRRLGVGPGDVVAWQLPNWIEAVVVHHATIRLGAVSGPIIPIYREREVAFILEQSRARVLVVPSTFRGHDYVAMIDALRPDLPDLAHVVVARAGEDRPDGFDALLGGPAAELAPPPPGTADDVVLLLYTSGTTADPKGALHTHETLGYEDRSIIDLFDLGPDDVVFMPSPLPHITGVLYGLHLPFMLGTTLVLQDVWDPARARTAIDRHGCTFMIAATPFLHGLVHGGDDEHRQLPTLRVFGCGGADVPPELIRQGERLLGATCTRVYGSTEFPTLSASNDGDPLERRATTDGRIIGLARARVVDEDDRDLPPGTAGSLLVRGPELFVGYLDAKLNDEAFTTEGWFRTGDLATVDTDGFVTITGRQKDIIIRGGENISAKEIEDLLFEHPGVADVAIVGAPDPVLVERVCAFVVAQDGRSTLSLGDLTSFLTSRHIARQKLPERLELVPSLPRTASGKVQKFRLRDALTP
ncbi:AMP-binding protein [Actinomycetospora sp. C-140]